MTTLCDTDKELLDFKKCDIFTPDNMSQLMASKLLTCGNLLEPSVGEGSLLKYLNLDNYDDIDIFDIKQPYLDKAVEILNDEYVPYKPRYKKAPRDKPTQKKSAWLIGK